MVRTPSTMLELGTRAPAFRLPDTDGRIVSSDDLAAAPALLVMFICNHCPFVKHVRHELARIGSDYAPRGAAIVAINSIVQVDRSSSILLRPRLTNHRATGFVSFATPDVKSANLTESFGAITGSNASPTPNCASRGTTPTA